MNDLYSSTCVIDGRMLFMAPGSQALWLTDGTVEGTRRVYELDGYSHLGCSVVDDQLYFTVANTTAVLSGNELWVTDGTTEGTMLIRDFGPDAELWGPFAVTNVVIFVVATPAEGAVMWVSDGTDAGTQPVTTLSQDSESRLQLQAIVG